MQEAQTLSNQTLGHYQIIREAGRGGMSMVYEAVDTRIGRRVALKALSIPMTLSPEMRSAMITRLNREARAIARLSHPNIVAIYDIGEERGQHFIVMEYLEGLTLRERLDEGPVPPEETQSILDQVSAGLDAVHDAGIVHRDIKPSNVMLLPGGRVKLMDFGVARQSEDTLVTQAGTMVGSPVYMSPEQINGDLCGPASDLWSLGIVLYEMLAGEPPFVGKNIPNVLFQVTHRSPPPLPRATRPMQQVMTRALDKDPAQRYGSARKLADAFRAALPAPAGSVPKPLRTPAPPLSPLRPRPPLLPRPIAWAAALLLLVLLAALPEALRPRRAPQAPVLIATRPAHRAAPKPPPRVRVAAARQERTFRPVKAAPRPVSRIPRAAAVLASPHRSRKRATFPQSVAFRPRVTTRRLHHRLAPAALMQAAAPPLARHEAPSPPIHAAPPAFPPTAASVSASGSSAQSEPNLLGTWHGRHSHNPATLVITQRDGNAFAGTMNVRTPEADVRIAVEGHVSPRTGEVSMRERRILWASKPRAWDLGSESGRMAGNGRIAGTGTDVKGRYGAWSFSR